MDIPLIDVTMQIHDSLVGDRRRAMEAAVHALDGVVSTHLMSSNPHLMLVEINPRRITGDQLLHAMQAQGLDAEFAVPDRL